ncbi:amino acid permease [Paenibacillus sp. YYML68]|uniref:amino acid permease n=1 Tax=Paenibacillus sp. YYML68 TaxID=2909250 RepID=UPI0024934ABD|nr:amino acid permease [Paenibacillus sp. YYML68]
MEHSNQQHNVSADSGKAERRLEWWQLALLGVACTIGTGFFLGSAIGLTIGGPALIAAFVLAALGTYFVFDALARMTIADPQKGSFRTYAKNAYGRWAGFSCGWVYWLSELLIMGSQLTALSLFSRFWFPTMPMWMLALVYAVLGLGVILLGTKTFDRAENAFAVMKIAAIFMFIVLAALILFDVIGGTGHAPKTPASYLPNGTIALWSAFIYAFYAFGGIEVMGLMATRLKNPKDGPKAGKVMLLLLGIIYVVSIGLALVLVPFGSFQTKESPFVTALADPLLPWVPHVFNATFIIAGFSTMVASLFAVTTILVSLAEERDAPPFFAKTTKKKEKPLRAIAFTAGGLGLSVLMALLLPDNLYEFVTTAAGLMLLYNWMFILLSSGRLLEASTFGKVKRYTGILLLALAISGTLLHETTRPGFFISLLFVVVVGIVTLVMQRVWRKHGDAADAHADGKTEGAAPAWDVRPSSGGSIWSFEPDPAIFSTEQKLGRLKTKVKSKADQ